jgi:hypothetical protein
MNTYTTQFTFGDVYGAGTYDNGTYSSAASTTTTGTGITGTSTNTGTLADTGTAVIVFITLACVIIFAALVIRMWRKPTKKLDAEH